MLSTHKNFKQMVQGFKEEMGFEELSELSSVYKQTKDQRCIAYCFVNQFGVLFNQSEKFPYLSSEDKVSFILQEVEKALLNYESSQGAKLQTLISTYAYRRCYAENNKRGYQKRKINYNTEIACSYESFVEEGLDWGELDHYESEFIDWIESMGLNENEYKYCLTVGLNNHNLTDTEIAKELNVTCATVHYIKKRLKTKLQLAFN